MMLFDAMFGRRDRLWFENGAAGVRQGKFAGQAAVDGKRIPIVGTTMSKEGLAFVSAIKILASELPFTFKLRERTIESRVRVERSEPMQAPERIVHRYFCVFTAIAADDWDAVVRYVDNKPEPKPVEIPKAIDDEFRALPGRVQDGIVACLVRNKRLATPSPGVAPLIRLRTGSVRDLGGGRSARDVLIHSRVVTRDEGLRSYDTRFRVYSDDRIELLG
jgi:hypothetical protein